MVTTHEEVVALAVKYLKSETSWYRKKKMGKQCRRCGRPARVKTVFVIDGGWRYATQYCEEHGKEEGL